MSNDSHRFRTRRQLEDKGWELGSNIYRKDRKRYLPLYEGKIVHLFDHRWATFEDNGKVRESTSSEKQNPYYNVLPRYWVEEKEVERELMKNRKNDAGIRDGGGHLCLASWLMAFRKITGATNERTLVGGIIPATAVGDSLPLWVAKSRHNELLSSVLSSMACDYVTRLKMSGNNLAFFIAKQLSVLPPTVFDSPAPWALHSPEAAPFADWVRPRALELTYTAWDIQPFAQDCGWNGAPFRWNPERRFLLRAELDAAYFHLYLPSNPDGSWASELSDPYSSQRTPPEATARIIRYFRSPQDAVAYILDSFPILRRRDEEANDGVYRTKETILAIYERMQKAARSYGYYDSVLTTPPAAPSQCHSGRE